MSITKETIVTENYCDECDEVIHALVGADDFASHKVGRVRCPKCGHIVRMCNECDNHDNCDKCPYKNAKIVKPLTDKEYVKWEKEHSPALYEKFLNGEFGDFYSEIAKDIEVEEKYGDEKTAKLFKRMKELGYELYDVTDDAVIYKDMIESINVCEKLLKFRGWKEVREYCSLFKRGDGRKSWSKSK